MAWLKHHPNPIPIINYEEAKNAKEISFLFYLTAMNFFFFGKKPKELELTYTVPWFEKEVVRRYLITNDEVHNQPIISAQRLIINELLRVKSAFFSNFVLLLFGYLIPETRYPNLFIYYNFVGEIEVIDDPSILHYFIVPLFIILLAHHNWCGVVLSVSIFNLGEILYEAMNGGGQIRFWVEYLSFVRKIVEEFDEHLRVVLGREPKSLVELFRLYIDFLRRAYRPYSNFKVWVKPTPELRVAV
jgi:hypothetical protein